jgi:predicted lipoprotein
MKIKIILTVLSFAVLLACNTNNKQSHVPGTYVNNTTGKYSVASDTLVIEASEGNRFKVNRKTGFNLIRDGKKGKREYETEKWNTIYNEKTGVLTETQRGKALIFYPDSNMLMIGKRVYKKLN